MYRFRITDGATHAEVFEARSESQFRYEILSAFQRFRSHRSGCQALRLHAWDGESWVDVRNQGVRPISLTERLVFSDSAGLWGAARSSARGAMHFNEQVGGLLTFLRATPQERRESLRAINGGRP